MDYTYQPQATTQGGGLLASLRSAFSGRSAVKHKELHNKRIVKLRSDRSALARSAREHGRPDSGSTVNEVVLGRSLLARLGYWLLMRGASATTPSHNWRGAGKKSKVTRSELRQNKIAEDLVSIVAANGKRRVLRVSDGKHKRVSAASSAETKPVVSSKRSAVTSVKAAVSVKSREAAGDGNHAVAQRGNAAKKNYPDHRLKKFEQDLFVKTERNIAAAMKEAREGISAEQLVVKFGLSVPEAGLIASKCK